MVPLLSCRIGRPERNLIPSSTSRKGDAMTTDNLTTDGFQHGLKGIAYDWQSLYAAAALETLEAELSLIAPEFAE